MEFFSQDFLSTSSLYLVHRAMAYSNFMDLLVLLAVTVLVVIPFLYSFSCKGLLVSMD